MTHRLGVRSVKKSIKKAKAAEPEVEQTTEEKVVHHLNGIHAAVNAIAQQMSERNALLRESLEVTKVRDETADEVLDAAIKEILANPPRLLARVEALEAALKAPVVVAPSGVLAVVKTKPGESTGTETFTQPVAAAPNGEVKRGRGRPRNPANCPHEVTETLANGLIRCLKCNAILPAAAEGVAIKTGTPDMGTPVVEAKPATPAEVKTVVAEVKEKLAEKAMIDPPKAGAAEADIQAYIESHPGVKIAELVRTFKLSFNRAEAYIETWGKAAPVVEANPEPVVEKPAPAPEPVVEAKPEPVKATIEDVRATAIEFSNKHGKEKLTAVLKKYVPAGKEWVSLSASVPTEQYGILLLELQNGTR